MKQNQSIKVLHVSNRTWGAHKAGITTAPQGFRQKSKPTYLVQAGPALQEPEGQRPDQVRSCLQATAQGALGPVHSTKVLSTFSGPRSTSPWGSEEARLRDAVSPGSELSTGKPNPVKKHQFSSLDLPVLAQGKTRTSSEEAGLPWSCRLSCPFRSLSLLGKQGVGGLANTRARGSCSADA